jgi:hypothetical protein
MIPLSVYGLRSEENSKTMENLEGDLHCESPYIWRSGEEEKVNYPDEKLLDMI